MERGKFVQMAIPGGEVLPNGKALPPPAPPEILNSEVLYKQIERGSDNDDGREDALLAFIRAHPSHSTFRNNPSALVAAIDEYGTQEKFLMTLGQHKLKHIRDVLIAMDPKPKTIVELGTYMGYSALALGAIMKEIWGPIRQGIKIWSMELDPRWAAITNEFLELAGLRDMVEVVVGAAADSMRRLKTEDSLRTVDVLVLDHWETFYLQDLKVCEELGLLRQGSVVFADNVLFPGAPEYLEYVKGSERYETTAFESMMPNGWKDVLEVTTVVRTQ